MVKFVSDKPVFKIINDSGTFWGFTTYYLIGVLR